MGGAHAASGAGHRGPLALWLVDGRPRLSIYALVAVGAGGGRGGRWVARTAHECTYSPCVSLKTRALLSVLSFLPGSANWETTNQGGHAACGYTRKRRNNIQVRQGLIHVGACLLAGPGSQRPSYTALHPRHANFPDYSLIWVVITNGNALADDPNRIISEKRTG